jgi:hypothetical protein
MRLVAEKAAPRFHRRVSKQISNREAIHSLRVIAGL